MRLHFWGLCFLGLSFFSFAQINENCPGVGTSFELKKLPKFIKAEEGKLTLYADFQNRSGEIVPLYIINRTQKGVKLDSQDGDIYLKLEFKNKQGEWQRAQGHAYSFCGNSYMIQPELKTNHYFKIAGYAPSKGELKEVRYKRYANELQLVSNSEQGFVDLKEVKKAKVDRMAIQLGSFDLVSQIVLGKIDLKKEGWQDWVGPKETAIWTLSQKRFPAEKVIPILEEVLKQEEDTRLVSITTSVLTDIKKRNKK